MKGARLDERVVADGLAESRAKAQALILAGEVLVDDVRVDKPGARVRAEARLRLRGALRRFASRGGEKLAGALDDLAIDPRCRACLDVGYGQLDSRLRRDPRVVLMERTNARHLRADAVPGPIDLVTVDVSFISVRLLLPRLAEVAPAAEWLILVKPQFEVGREQVGKGGVVRDDAARAGAVAAVRAAAEALGWRAAGEAESRLAGPKGNREVFLWLRRASS